MDVDVIELDELIAQLTKVRDLAGNVPIAIVENGKPIKHDNVEIVGNKEAAVIHLVTEEQ